MGIRQEYQALLLIRKYKITYGLISNKLKKELECCCCECDSFLITLCFQDDDNREEGSEYKDKKYVQHTKSYHKSICTQQLEQPQKINTYGALISCTNDSLQISTLSERQQQGSQSTRSQKSKQNQDMNKSIIIVKSQKSQSNIHHVTQKSQKKLKSAHHINEQQEQKQQPVYKKSTILVSNNTKNHQESKLKLSQAMVKTLKQSNNLREIYSSSKSKQKVSENIQQQYQQSMSANCLHYSNSFLPQINSSPAFKADHKFRSSMKSVGAKKKSMIAYDYQHNPPSSTASSTTSSPSKPRMKAINEYVRKSKTYKV